MKVKGLSTALAFVLSAALIAPMTAMAAPNETVSENSATKQEETVTDAKAKTAETKTVDDDEVDKVTDDNLATEYADLDVEAGGTIVDCSVTWSISGSTLTIDGSGAMTDLITWNAPGHPYVQPWYDYRGSITTINIGSGITYIGQHAFDGMTALTSVTIPANVRGIGFAAFADCTGLQSATINAEKIGESAFIRCTSLTSVTIGSSVKDMGISAFEDCNNLQSVNISDMTAWCNIYFGGILSNPLEKAHHLYLNGSEVTSVTVPGSVTKVPDYAFINAESITSVTLSDGVQEVGEYAFYQCRGIKTLNFPTSSLTKIGGYAFESCTGLGLSSFPSSIDYYGCYCFRYCPLGDLTVPNGYIGRGAFQKCGTIGFITFGEKVKYIGENAFDGISFQGVTYHGSQAQWNAIRKGTGNGNLTTAPLTCQGSGSPDASTAYTPKTVAKFGNYNGSDIEWLILETSGSKALVVSKRILEIKLFDTTSNNKDWATSEIRTWLNGTFLSSAFSSAQQGKISTTSVSTPANSRYGTSGGANTSDKIFLLSEAEVRKYFPYEEDAAAKLTTAAYNNSSKDSAISNPDSTSDNNSHFGSTSYWWLRGTGMYGYEAEYVDYLGYVHKDGMTFNNTITGIRPAMWVDYSSLSIVETGVDGFVTRLYSVCFDRLPDSAGKNDWVSRLNNGQVTGTTAAAGFVFSQEFKNKNLCNTCFVKQLYKAIMGREYDQGGLEYWVGKLESGSTREEVFNGFSQSDEFNNICNEYGIQKGDPLDIPQYGTVPTGKCTVCGTTDGVTAFVTRLYNVCLDRDPDDAGLADWTGKLWAHERSGRDVSFGFIFSKEFQNRGFSNEDYVEYLYKAFFGRASDAAGKADWVGRLNGGASREDVFNGFVGSTEFDNLCKKYGITRDK
ncbi:MAG: DUF4214 domain-containing protein [Lachnospiraceae bacterium]|nr:DUF4214 domain-containing protein [Lachnospiraceae bacterium]